MPATHSPTKPESGGLLWPASWETESSVFRENFASKFWVEGGRGTRCFWYTWALRNVRNVHSPSACAHTLHTNTYKWINKSFESKIKASSIYTVCMKIWAWSKILREVSYAVQDCILECGKKDTVGLGVILFILCLWAKFHECSLMPNFWKGTWKKAVSTPENSYNLYLYHRRFENHSLSQSPKHKCIGNLLPSECWTMITPSPCQSL